MHNLYVDARLINDKVRLSAVSRAHPDDPVVMDYVPPLGDGQGFGGIELLLASFCGCVSTAVIALLKRAGRHILSYECTAEGIRQETPVLLKKIMFEVRLRSDDAEAQDIERILHAAETISPVWLAIKSNVEVQAGYKLTR